MDINSKITVFGGTGMVGSALVRRLEAQGYVDIDAPSSKQVNLLEKDAVYDYFKDRKPAYVFMVAGLVGGIMANKERTADFLYQNTLMALHVLDGMQREVPKSKLLFTGSTCIYPRENPQPINEGRLLSGPLEETNKGYALAKIVGVVGCELYRQQHGLNAIAVMPTNMYGPNDTYDLHTSHMIPALIKKFVDAKREGKPFTLWGSGKPRREALFVDDCADACIYLMKTYDGPDIVNIGTGFDYSIKEFADIIGKVVGYDGEIAWDASKPDGTFEKRTDISRLKNLMPHFKPRSLEEGVKAVIEHDFKE